MLGMGEKLRGIIHRIAGVVLIGAGIYHVFYLAIAREGRRLLRDIAPRPKDAFDAWGTMRYYLGLSREKPKFGRFNYAEKAEYWALVWGTALMGLTGIMMWAKVWVGNLLARWWVDVATAIHFYEAILATLAILVWHFYQVFFDPDVYPMNWAWWDGKMPVEHYRMSTSWMTDEGDREPGAGNRRAERDVTASWRRRRAAPLHRGLALSSWRAMSEAVVASASRRPLIPETALTPASCRRASS